MSGMGFRPGASIDLSRMSEAEALYALGRMTYRYSLQSYLSRYREGGERGGVVIEVAPTTHKPSPERGWAPSCGRCHIYSKRYASEALAAAWLDRHLIEYHGYVAPREAKWEAGY